MAASGISIRANIYPGWSANQKLAGNRLVGRAEPGSRAHCWRLKTGPKRFPFGTSRKTRHQFVTKTKLFKGVFAE